MPIRKRPPGTAIISGQCGQSRVTAAALGGLAKTVVEVSDKLVAIKAAASQEMICIEGVDRLLFP